MMTAMVEDLIGDHESMREVRRMVARVASSPIRTVLLYGETGTGKGVVARLLHSLSARGDRKFVDVNCAAIPDNLVESELFGHEKGAFTSAVGLKIGLIESGNGGTVFLDEIREMPLVMQAKLLTLLDTQTFRRIGSVKPIEVDVRFIATTNKILLSEVKAGRFREDLYYRLQVVAINLPPLRERGNDLSVLMDHFLRRFSERYGRVIRGAEPAVEEIFRQYYWPGNVREFRNLLERIFIMEDEDRILVRHIPPRIMREVRAGRRTAGDETLVAADETLGCLPFHAATAGFQRRYIEAALARHGGSLSRTAQAVGLSRHALRHQLRKLESA